MSFANNPIGLENYVVRIIEKLFVIYFLSYFIFDLALFLIFLFTFRRESRIAPLEKFPKVSIIVPAFNEQVSIANCVKMLRSLDYPEFEIIVVNDGSADDTQGAVVKEFGLAETQVPVAGGLQTAGIVSFYRSVDGSLSLVNKKNGGKADSLNAGINLSGGEIVCTIDADSILDRSSLLRVVNEMVRDESVFVSGGQIAVANDTVIRNGKVVNAKMPSNPLVLWQITEYIKSFFVSRIGLSKINSILIMSGAFSVFRKKDLYAIGGFLTGRSDGEYIRSIFESVKTTVCEDMEIVVRLWRYYRETGRKCRAVYLAKPLCWTEVPDNLSNLFKQRTRWHLGLAETISMHKKMMFDPNYKTTGLVALPYYFFYELASPLIKIAALAFIAYVGFAGLVNIQWVVYMAVFITVTSALIISVVTVYIESWSEKQSAVSRNALRYKSFMDWATLIFFSIISDFSYSFFRIAAQVKGLTDFLRKKSEWNKFERKGVRSIGPELSKSNSPV
ncbi:MAG: glycosyltransferase [Ignavibacteria bacterium]|nr:glycosyltransferase [Ignavibacteria bacterium]